MLRAAGLSTRLARGLASRSPTLARQAPLASSAAAASSVRWCAAGAPGATGGTRLGAYLESCGANWGDAYEVERVRVDESSRTFSWRVDLPPERLAALRQGDPLESPTFPLPGGSRGRFQLFPKGDSDCSAQGFCSLWLCTDAGALGSIRLKLGGAEARPGGASEFCRLEDVLADGAVEVSLQLEEGTVSDTKIAVEQSLRLTGLEIAEWQLFQASRLKAAGGSGSLISSPPFRFHHVLLGDMYLELIPGVPHPEHCAVLFRCRVPTMQLRVNLSVGSAFSKSIIALGRSTAQEDLKSASFLQVNLDAPGVLAEDGSLTVRCMLDEVVAIPPALRDMIPRLDERANWPKRI